MATENKELNSYELSRNFFDWCFENPEKVSPSHTAIYFFAIEHCNRMGWKSKFGFPTQMVMDAIGIKKHETYIRYFNDLIEWGFLILVQKSTNQYSANIISINNAMPKNGKALEKATRNHAGKQTRKQPESIGESNGESNRSILKQENKETIEPIKPINNISDEKKESDKNWKNDFDVYVEDLRNAYTEIQNDSEWIKQQESFYLNVDIIKSIEKACVNYWSTPAGWKKKKQSKISEINWKSTFGNAISLNKVYKNGNSNLQSGASFSNSENKQNPGRTYPKNNRSELEALRDLSHSVLQNT